MRNFLLETSNYKCEENKLNKISTRKIGRKPGEILRSIVKGSNGWMMNHDRVTSGKYGYRTIENVCDFFQYD